MGLCVCVALRVREITWHDLNWLAFSAIWFLAKNKQRSPVSAISVIRLTHAVKMSLIIFTLRIFFSANKRMSAYTYWVRIFYFVVHSTSCASAFYHWIFDFHRYAYVCEFHSFIHKEVRVSLNNSPYSNFQSTHKNVEGKTNNKRRRRSIEQSTEQERDTHR